MEERQGRANFLDIELLHVYLPHVVTPLQA
jgi:hypothetical protein